MFRVGHSQLRGLGSGASIARFLDHGAVKPGTRTIPTCWSGRLIPHTLRTFFFRAVNKRACCPRTAGSRSCWLNITFDMSIIPARVATTGTSGIRSCPASFKACWNTWRRRAKCKGAENVPCSGRIPDHNHFLLIERGMSQNKSVVIRPAKTLAGSVRLPADKSISHPYAMLGAIAEGTTKLENFSTGADCASTLRCLRALGVKWERNGGLVACHSPG